MTGSKLKRINQNSTKPRFLVFFNASVILAGIKSPHGASGTLLQYGASKQFHACASELVFQEVFRHTNKLGLTDSQVLKIIRSTFFQPYIAPPPSKKLITKWTVKTTDPGDAHVLAACHLTLADFLVSLDKKHILNLAETINQFKIVTPLKMLRLIRQNTSA